MGYFRSYIILSLRYFYVRVFFSRRKNVLRRIRVKIDGVYSCLTNRRDRSSILVIFLKLNHAKSAQRVSCSAGIVTASSLFIGSTLDCKIFTTWGATRVGTLNLPWISRRMYTRPMQGAESGWNAAGIKLSVIRIVSLVCTFAISRARGELDLCKIHFEGRKRYGLWNRDYERAFHTFQISFRLFI